MRVVVHGRKMFFDVDGAKLVPDGPSMRERPTVLLLHGGPGMDHASFKPAFARLTEVAQVVYVDHFGQGRSDAIDPADWRLDIWADAIHKLCDSLEIVEPIVLGWSFGGMVAMAYATRHPDQLSKLILMTTAAELNLAGIEASFDRIAGADVAAAAVAHFTTPSAETFAEFARIVLPVYSPAPLDIDLFTRGVETPGLSLGTWNEAFRFDLRPALSLITCPTLILAGELDPITPPVKSEDILAHLPDGIGRLIRYPRSGHLPQLTEPDALFGDITAFITDEQPAG